MDLAAIFEPLVIIHWDFNPDNFDNQYINDYKLDVRLLRDDNQNVMGFAAIMKSHLSAHKLFLSYIAQQDIIVPEIRMMKVGHFKKFIYQALQFYVEEFYQIVQLSREKMPFEVILHPEELDALYDERFSKL